MDSNGRFRPHVDRFVSSSFRLDSIFIWISSLFGRYFIIILLLFGHDVVVMATWGTQKSSNIDKN